MFKGLKGKFKKAKIILILVGSVSGIFLFAALLFGAGTSISDFFKDFSESGGRLSEDDLTDLNDLNPTDEMVMHGMIESMEEDDIGNFYLTKDDMLMLLEKVDEANKNYTETTINYEYYYEKWCIVGWTEVTYTEDMIEYSGVSGPEYASHGSVPIWGWSNEHYDWDQITINNEPFERKTEYKVSWQPIYCLAVMASAENNFDWYDINDAETGKLRMQYRLDETVLDHIIDTFTYTYTYAFDGARGDHPEDYVKKDGRWYGGTKKIEYDTSQVVKWRDMRYFWDPTTHRTGHDMEEISYYVEWYADAGDSWENPRASFDDEREHIRWIKKIPATTLLSVSNSYLARYFTVEPNNVPIRKYKEWKEGVDTTEGTHYDSSCKYKDNMQIIGGFEEKDVDLFYQACKTLYSEFNWEYFLDLLATTPNSDALVEEYRDMYNQWKSHSRSYEKGSDVLKTEVGAGEFGMEDVIIGYQRNDLFIYDENGLINTVPDLAEFSSSYEVTRTLAEKDNGGVGITLEEIQYCIDNYNPIARRDTSVLKMGGVANAFYRIQEDYGVSALGLLAIACNESAYGTSHLAYDKWNLFGWGANDSNPYGDAKNFKQIYGTPEEAVYQALRQITVNYIKGRYHQDSYYTMRYNNNVHQYCTSTTWPYTNASIRRRLENFLGISVEGVVSEAITPFRFIGDAQFSWPVNGTVTSEFGPRNTGIKGASTNHKGIDIAAPERTPIYAAADGVVCRNTCQTTYVDGKRKMTGWGYYIKIFHGGGYSTLYAHMYEPSPLHIGEEVKRGQVIGYVGQTGVASGPHCHFEVWSNQSDMDVAANNTGVGSYQIDPRPFLP